MTSAVPGEVAVIDKSCGRRWPGLFTAECAKIAEIKFTEARMLHLTMQYARAPYPNRFSSHNSDSSSAISAFSSEAGGESEFSGPVTRKAHLRFQGNTPGTRSLKGALASNTGAEILFAGIRKAAAKSAIRHEPRRFS
jgi:hypothetical protein